MLWWHFFSIGPNLPRDPLMAHRWRTRRRKWLTCIQKRPCRIPRTGSTKEATKSKSRICKNIIHSACWTCSWPNITLNLTNFRSKWHKMMSLTPGNLHNSCSETLSESRLPFRSASSGSTSFCCGFAELILTRLPFESNGVQIQAIRDMIVADTPIRSIDKKVDINLSWFCKCFLKIVFCCTKYEKADLPVEEIQWPWSKGRGCHRSHMLWSCQPSSTATALTTEQYNQIYFVKKLCNTLCKNPCMYLLDTTSL